jgi:hypothetical protein
MGRRKPVVFRPEGPDRPAAPYLSASYLDELLLQARVPHDKRRACADRIHQLFDWYRSRLGVNERQSEAQSAESLRQFAEAARKLYEVTASLAPASRWDVEPDYRAFIERVRKAQAAERASAVAYDVMTRELAKRDPEAEPLEDVSLPENAWSALNRQHRKQSPLPVQLPLELILAAHIEKADRRRSELEAQVSPGRSRSRGTFARNELALNLKAIAIGYSPKLAEDQREAEAKDWAASVLRAAGFERVPYRETNPRAFERMFARGEDPRL